MLAGWDIVAVGTRIAHEFLLIQRLHLGKHIRRRHAIAFIGFHLKRVKRIRQWRTLCLAFPLTESDASRLVLDFILNLLYIVTLDNTPLTIERCFIRRFQSCRERDAVL